MNVLSLFDGMSCGMIALERVGITVSNYFASEIDKYAIKVSEKNYPDIIRLGDVTKVTYKEGVLYSENGQWNVGKIDLVLAGSPCQGFSIAGKQLAFEDERSKLYFEFERIIEEVKPTYFLLENVRMKQEFSDIVSERLGVKPIAINSNLVSAQNRLRLYWTNIPNVQQPDDKGKTLETILLDKELLPDSISVSVKGVEYMDREVSGGRTHWDFSHHSDSDSQKSMCLSANMMKGVPYNVLIDRRGNKCHMEDCDFQDDIDVCKSCTDSYQSKYVPTKTIRRFHPIECERLQTVPVGYTSCVSDSQRYKMLGNGWTVDVIAHILQNLNEVRNYLGDMNK